MWEGRCWSTTLQRLRETLDLQVLSSGLLHLFIKGRVKSHMSNSPVQQDVPTVVIHIKHHWKEKAWECPSVVRIVA